jgi:hypothetical protein
VRESLEPDLAVLRSFVNPSWDLIDVIKMIGTREVACWTKPPDCTLFWGGHSATCVMTDLNIKMTAFFADGKPSRAEVSVTLKEQTFSPGPIVDFVKRHVEIVKGYVRMGSQGTAGEDFLAATPIVNLFA